MSDILPEEDVGILASASVLQNVPGLIQRPEEDEEEESRQRNLWDNLMQNDAKPVRYSKTIALLLSWTETDLKKTDEEVDALEDVLKNTYNFTVQKASLNKEKEALVQIEKHLMDFIYDHDAKGVLLIIYYAGHGWAPVGKVDEFYFLGKTGQQAQKDERNILPWITAERLLTERKADFLVILDCCQAGTLCTYRGSNRFEYLGACGADQMTPPPGETSFTRALIWALVNLRSKPSFPVSELQRMIKQAPKFPKNLRPALGHRFDGSYDHIMLAPMKNSDTTVNEIISQHEESHDRPKGFLDLRFQYRMPVTDDMLTQTSEELRPLIANERIPLECISLIRNHSQSTEPKLLQIVSQVMGQFVVQKYALRWKLKALKEKRTAEDHSEYPTSIVIDESTANGAHTKSHHSKETLLTRTSLWGNVRVNQSAMIVGLLSIILMLVTLPPLVNR